MLLCIKFAFFIRSFVRPFFSPYVINCCVILSVKLSYLFPFSRKLNWNSFFCTLCYHQDNAAKLAKINASVL